MRRLTAGAVALLALCAALVGCHSAPKDDPILKLSSEEAFAEGQRLVEEKKYDRAQEYFGHAFQVAPNTSVGREALLLQAEALYLDGGEDNYIKAEARYRDFLNRFPTSDRADYAQYQLARSLEARMRKPDRDQSATRKALDAYGDLLQLFPTSEYVDEAEAGIDRIRDNLAEHEFLVGKYQLRRGLAGAAVSRFEGLLEGYPEYGDRAKVLHHLGRAYHKMDEDQKALETFERLEQEYPESEWARDIPKWVGGIPKEVQS
ncbi:MAG: outer membrane protein assembly factor BamD [Thermoanaerobaculia bacterium]